VAVIWQTAFSRVGKNAEKGRNDKALRKTRAQCAVPGSRRSGAPGKLGANFVGLCAPNFLFIRENTGKFSTLSVRGPNTPSDTPANSYSWEEIPWAKEQGILSTEQGMLRAYQGTSRLERGGAGGWGRQMEINASSQQFAVSTPHRFLG
jgi:hypothetical protein